MKSFCDFSPCALCESVFVELPLKVKGNIMKVKVAKRGDAEQVCVNSACSCLPHQKLSRKLFSGRKTFSKKRSTKSLNDKLRSLDESRKSRSLHLRGSEF